MVSQTDTGDTGKPGQEREKVGKSIEGKSRREKEGGEGTDLFMGTKIGLRVRALGDPGGTSGTRNPSGVAILHRAAVSLSRRFIMQPLSTTLPNCE